MDGQKHGTTNEKEVFSRYRQLEVHVILSYDDGNGKGLSSDNKELRTPNDPSAAGIFEDSPGADTEMGYENPDGFIITGAKSIQGYKVSIYRNRAMFNKYRAS
jgi:hypothetical protein